MQLTTDKVPIDQLAELEYDKSVLFFGVVPLVVIGVLAVICLVLYIVRRSKNWNDLGESMRAEDAEPGNQDGFSTQEMAAMDATKPSQRLANLTKSDEA